MLISDIQVGDIFSDSINGTKHYVIILEVHQASQGLFAFKVIDGNFGIITTWDIRGSRDIGFYHLELVHKEKETKQ